MTTDSARVAEFLSLIEKFDDTLTEAAKSLQGGVELRRPDKRFEVENKISAYQKASLEPELLEHYEAVVDDWIQQVERLLAESEQDWKDSEDSGPDTELEFWRNRMAKFNSVAEQLKSKDAKMVLGVISSAKSKVLKRWKEVDNGITDALNEAKVTEGGGDV